MEEDDLIFRGTKGELIFVMTAILYFVVARFIAVLLHEVVGHGLISELIGGDFYAFYASPALGFTHAYIANGTHTALVILYLLSGIIVELIVGLVVLLVIYPRLKSFFQKLFALLLLEALLVHSVTYLALGSGYGETGDSFQVIGNLPGLDVFWMARFLFTGIIFAVAFAYVISKKALDLLSDHFILRTRMSALRLLLLFWVPPLLAGGVAGVFGIGLVSDVLLNYLLIFTIFTVSAFVFASILVSREHLPGELALGIKRKGVISTLVAFLLVLSIWFLAFGVTPSTAHGILLTKPPIEEESRYIDGYAVNLHLIIGADYTVTAEIRLKALNNPGNPLEEAIWDTFKDRPHWPTYDAFSLFVMKGAFNTTGWQVVNHSTGANVHYEGEVATKGKFIAIEYTNANYSLFRISNGEVVFRIYDPWKGSNVLGDQYVDSLNITWDASLNLVRWPQGGGLPPVDDPPVSNYITWIFSSFEEAHIGYELAFE